MSDMLTKNLAREEFACKGINCCSHSAPVTRELVEALQILRNMVNAPLRLSSGFRCITHNREEGSRDTSQHVIGKAADVITPSGYTPDEFYAMAESLFQGVGRYPWGLHVDVRNGISARWDKR